MEILEVDVLAAQENSLQELLLIYNFRLLTRLWDSLVVAIPWVFLVDGCYLQHYTVDIGFLLNPGCILIHNNKSDDKLE